jgi:hypothetical protein
MTKLNPFRVSFDAPLARSERRRGRIAAVVVWCMVPVLGVAALVTLLNASSGMIAAWSNARLLAEDSKPCDQQTWPYIPARCQKLADLQPTARTVEHSAQAIALQSASPAANAKTETAPARQPSTTGSAPPAENTGPAATGPGASTHLSQREQGRSQRESRLQRERRAEVRKARKQQSRARMEARNGERRATGADARSVRQGTEYGYESRSGRDQQMFVNRRGALDDDFFRIFR